MHSPNRGTYRATPERQLDVLQIQDGNPALGYETLLRHVQVEQVQRMINRLYLSHLHEPVLYVLRGCHEHPVTMVLSLVQHLQINSNDNFTVRDTEPNRTERTVFKSSMRVITPMAISLLSAGASGHGYSVALNPSQIFFTRVFNWSPWKNIINTDLYTWSP